MTSFWNKDEFLSDRSFDCIPELQQNQRDILTARHYEYKSKGDLVPKASVCPVGVRLHLHVHKIHF